MRKSASKSHRSPDMDLERGSWKSRFLFWLLFLLVVGAGATFMFWPRLGLQPDEGDTASTRLGQNVGLRSVVLYFADRDAGALLTERREIPMGPTLEERIESTLRALVEGPDQQGALPVLPRQTRVMQSFYDEEDGTLYVDFNTALVTQQPGGSAAEYYSLGALVRTIGANFPEVVAVQILVDGQPVDSLAGHFDTSKPLDVATWQ